MLKIMNNLNNKRYMIKGKIMTKSKDNSTQKTEESIVAGNRITYSEVLNWIRAKTNGTKASGQILFSQTAILRNIPR